ncbi:MAG: hypothetical protein MUE63_07240 [Xanthomonadales bacterium]|jgi:hypothetical protein|nr:hypothetical protein [Burkholderiaceae bacterium]MCU0989364.1 hypothetical protein [Xanthomonadales bacterium]
MSKSLFAWVVLLCAGFCQAAVYTEVGDAGDFLNPQNVAGSAITRIEGTIGGDDEVDAFRFYFSGGPLMIQARANVNPDPDFEPTWVALSVALFREQALAHEPCSPLNPCTSAVGELDLWNAQLVAGNYVLGACYPPNPCLASDPPFSFDLQYPSTGELGTPLPEPPLLPLLALGLAALLTQRSRLGSCQLSREWARISHFRHLVFRFGPRATCEPPRATVG